MAFHFRTITVVVRQYRVFVLLWLLFLAWQLLNLVPLPASLIASLRPEKLLPEYANVSADTSWLPLSFDVGQSQIVFLKSLCYCLLFFQCFSLGTLYFSVETSVNHH